MQKTSTPLLAASVVAICGLLVGTTVAAQSGPEPIAAEPLSSRNAVAEGTSGNKAGVPRHVCRWFTSGLLLSATGTEAG